MGRHRFQAYTINLTVITRSKNINIDALDCAAYYFEACISIFIPLRTLNNLLNYRLDSNCAQNSGNTVSCF